MPSAQLATGHFRPQSELSPKKTSKIERSTMLVKQPQISVKLRTMPNIYQKSKHKLRYGPQLDLGFIHQCFEVQDNTSLPLGELAYLPTIPPLTRASNDSDYIVISLFL